MGLSAFQKTSYRIFGAFATRHLYQEDLEDDLQAARIPVRAEAYLATAVASTIITVLVTALISAFAVLVLLPAAGLPATHPIALAAAVGSPILLGLSVYAILLTSPKSKANQRAKDIDNHLPYALNYVAAMASAGVPTRKIFESLAGQPIYGEMANEARAIAKDMNLGIDGRHALDRASRRTPSENLAEVLQGAITTLTSGGDLQSYFSSKAERYAFENRQEQKKFVEVMGLMSETYVTAVVAGPLFLIVMMAIMAMLGGGEPTILRLIVYLVLPIANAGFAWGLSEITPEV
jgi:flagellar protein FlaJ